MDHTRFLHTPALLQTEGRHKELYLLLTCVHFTQWTVIDQTAYSYYEFQRGKKVYVRNVIITLLLTMQTCPLHPHHGSIALLRGSMAAFRRSLRHTTVRTKAVVPTNTQHTYTQKRCHCTKMILTHCGRVTQICVFNTVKLGTSASSP